MLTPFTFFEAAEVIRLAQGNLDSDHMSDSARSKLFDAFVSEMPYGTQKARDGDPDQWIADRLNAMSEEVFTEWLGSRTKVTFS